MEARIEEVLSEYAASTTIPDMANQILLDRIWAALKESARAWTAAEIAHDFLRLQGPAPDPLVRGILRLDARFRENPPGIWRARSRSEPPLRRGEYVLAWIQTDEQPLPRSWRAHFLPAGDPGTGDSRRNGRAPVLTVHADQPEAWERLRATLGSRRIVTTQPGLLQRFQQWMERAWGFPEWEGSPLDLTSWARMVLVREGVPASESLAQARIPALARRWSLGPVTGEGEGSVLHAVSEIFDHLLSLHGAWTEEKLEEAIREALSGRPVPWEDFAFTREEIEAVPATSGIYRFRGGDGRLLYVGKSACLARRVQSYFRPLPPEPSKRAELLASLRQVEIIPLPSELEALVMEARAIRTEAPLHNVQVEVHPSPVLPPHWWWPVLFLAPGADPRRASVFLLEDASSGVLFHVPREGSEEMLERLASWLDRAIKADRPAASGGDGFASEAPDEGGTATAPDECGTAPDPEECGTASAREAAAGTGAASTSEGLPLHPEEARLVLRYYVRQRESCHRIDPLHFSSGYALAEALLSAARGEPEISGSLDYRPPGSVQPGLQGRGL